MGLTSFDIWPAARIRLMEAGIQRSGLVGSSSFPPPTVHIFAGQPWLLVPFLPVHLALQIQ
jgi:hypothetical protein